ncbi:MAG: pyridoxal-phosphate dependent enzyme [Gammaproteobacteria bacterium]|nr:pyridoxal-phosphate dependent enzyme [Gammaproteobacteria bacterium]
MISGPGVAEIKQLRQTLGEQLVRTPMLRCAALEDLLGADTRVFGKLEFLQRTGTFKARGALATLHGLNEDQRAAGVTAVSAGNHAVATAFAAQAVGASAKIVMLAAANPVRIELCRSFGATLVLVDNVHEAFEVAERIEEDEGRFLVHPFEGPLIAAGTGMVGLEICEQCDQFDAVIVPIGGGGLLGGIANAIKQLRPDCELIGVEPQGADSMHRSFAAGEPRSIDKVRTIADSLGAPFTMPYSFGLCRQNVDDLVLVDDLQLRRAMGCLFRAMKIAVEPACAASTAALLGPLRERLRGKTVVLLFCGSNIDWATFEAQAIFENSDAA